MAEPKTRTYESSTLGLPPLKMVLVHARNDAQNASLETQSAATAVEETTPLDKEQAVRKIIQLLEAPDR